jgi:hypothetical protein
MIVELPDDRELEFPDSMTEDQIDGIVKVLLNAEAAASAARAEVAVLTTELRALRAHVEKKGKPSSEGMGVAEALRALQSSFDAGFHRLLRAQLADRILVRDESGEPYKSKAVEKSS